MTFPLEVLCLEKLEKNKEARGGLSSKKLEIFPVPALEPKPRRASYAFGTKTKQKRIPRLAREY